MKTFLSLAGSSVMVLALFAAAPAFAQDNGNLLGPPGGPFALVTHPENLPKQDVAAKFPQGWPMAYYTAARNGSIPGASTTSDGYRWKFAGARAWPLDRKLYGYQAIGIKLAETTAAQWLGNTIGVSAVRGVILAESSDQFIYALNARTGQLVWRTSPVGSTYMGQPIVHGNLVYVNAGTVGFTYGNTRKYAKTGHAIRGQGVAYNGIYALNFKTGKLLWRHMTEGDLMPTLQWDHDNRYLWEGVEVAARRMAKQGSDLYVVSGPIFRGSEKRMKSGNGPLIPAYFFKAIYDPAHHRAAAYVTSNTGSNDYSVVPIAYINRLVGIDIFPKMSEDVAGKAWNLPAPRPQRSVLPAKYRVPIQKLPLPGSSAAHASNTAQVNGSGSDGPSSHGHHYREAFSMARYAHSLFRHLSH